MGVLNITPDSFSDGAQYLEPIQAVKKAESLAEDGADYIDIGAESTRPGARPICESEEWSRLEPVLKILAKTDLGSVKLSIDTTKSAIMIRALDLGVSVINDVGGVRSFETLKKLASYKPEYIAMHAYKTPRTMQVQPQNVKKALSSVSSFFKKAYENLKSAGFSHKNIWLDPGIGFGKTDAANLNLLSAVKNFSNSYQMVVGTSRKSWLGRFLGINEPIKRDQSSKMIELGLVFLGCRLIRTHEVKTLKKLLSCLDSD